MSSAREVIALLDGSRDRDQVVAAAVARGVPQAVAERILLLLAAAGMLIDFRPGTLGTLPHELKQQLMPELAAASLSRQDCDGGVQVLARRAATVVQVCGTDRIATSIAELLTSSGVAASNGPLAVSADDVGRIRAEPLDLVILVGRQPPELVIGLHRRRVPHLAVSAIEAIGVVGPLVQPGVSTCLRCMDLTRAERDPAWPLILAQLRARDASPRACDAALAAAVAAQAAAQALAFTDQAPLAPATANGTLELVLPDWQWRRRTWRPHPACICGSTAAA